MCEVAYLEINSKYQIVSKRREFKTEAAMQKFIEKLFESGNLYQLLGTRN